MLFNVPLAHYLPDPLRLCLLVAATTLSILFRTERACRPFLLCFGQRLGHISSCRELEYDEEDEKEGCARAPEESPALACRDMAILDTFAYSRRNCSFTIL